MSEPNEKILKRAPVEDEEAAQVAGGVPQFIRCSKCGQSHLSDYDCSAINGFKRNE